MLTQLNLKVVLLLILAFSMSGNMFAQDAQQEEDGDFMEELPASFGILAGFGINKLKLPNNYDGDITDPDWTASSNTLTIGLTYEKPIYILNLALYANLLASKASYATSSRSQSVDTDVLINMTSLDAALLLRHTVGKRDIRPFFYAGGVFSYHIENTGKIYEATVQSDQVVINLLTHRPLVSDFSIGYGLGAGVKKFLGTKTRGVSLELRYTSIGHTKEYVSCNQFAILAGFTF